MDSESLITEAREAMLTEGNVMPMIYLELTNHMILMALDVLSDEQSIPSQAGLLARLGWEQCKKYPGEQVRSIGFYAKAWRADHTDDVVANMNPVKSPHRQEVIIVSRWQAEDPQRQCYILPVIRDHKKHVVDVGPAQGPTFTLPIHLAAFLQGAQDAQRPDEEVLSQMRNTLTQRISQLSPDKQQKLMEFLRKEGMPS